MSTVRNSIVHPHKFIAFADFEPASTRTLAEEYVVTYSDSGSPQPGTLSSSEIGVSIVRRLKFFVDPTDLPFLLVPLIAHHLWPKTAGHNLIFAYPGVLPQYLSAAADALSNGAEAVLLRDDASDSIVLGLAGNSRNRRLITHWADSVDRFSRAPDQPALEPFFGGVAANYLCDHIVSLRSPLKWTFSRTSSTQKSEPKIGAELIQAAVRNLMPFSEALLDDPATNTVLSLNRPAREVPQDCGCLISELMVFVRAQRRDLEEAFDITTEQGRRGFAQWFLARAAIEFDIGTEFVEPVRAAQSCEPNIATELPVVPVLPQGEKKNPSPGCNLIGYPRAEMGMGEQIRSCAASLQEVGSELHMVDFSFGIVASQGDRRYDHLLGTDNPCPFNLFHINADQIPLAVEKLGADFFRDKYNVAYWEWELAEFPTEWMPSLDRMDEVWAPSTFIENAVSKHTTKPVIWMPLAVECPIPPRDPQITRASFSLPSDAYLFLFSFDFSSFATRKNFRAGLEAFRRAFPDKQQVGLVLKTIRHAHHQREFWELLREVADDERIFIIDRVLRQHEMRALTACCDSFLSLHRSEGFGLGIAEAMYLGKPVVVTNYSGNTDFTLPDNSCLVDYKLIPVKEGEYLFPEGQVWADPDVDHAASYMKRLVADRDYGAKLGRAAAAFIRKQHSFKAVGTRYLKRLKQIETAREILSPSKDDEGALRGMVNRLRNLGGT